MLAPYGLDRVGTQALPQSSRSFCGYRLYAACVGLGGNQPEVRERIGECLARGYGCEFLAEMGSHFAHLGPGVNHAPVAEHMRREFAAEIERARQEDDGLLRQSGGSPEPAGVHCDDCGEAIPADEDAVEKLRSRPVDHSERHSASFWNKRSVSPASPSSTAIGKNKATENFL